MRCRPSRARSIPADVVILALGVRPDTTLAKAAGLDIGERGGIRVDEHMRTSDPDIFAVGDAVEVKEFGTGQWNLDCVGRPSKPPRPHRRRCDRRARLPLPWHAGHLDHRAVRWAAPWTGVSEKTLKRLGDTDYEKVYLFPNSHAGYYPGQVHRHEVPLPQV